MRKIIWPLLVVALSLIVGSARAQYVTVRTVTSCGSVSPYTSPGAGSPWSLTADTNGNLCTNSTGGGGGAITAAAGSYAAGFSVDIGTASTAVAGDNTLSGWLKGIYNNSSAPLPAQSGHGVNTGGVEGLVANGSAYSGNNYPVLVGGSDNSSNARILSVDTSGRANVNAALAGSATGGLSTYFVQPTAGDNHANIKNGAGTVYHITVTNNSATINYLRLYNAASGFNGCNSATNLVYQAAIPANSTNAAGLVDNWTQGIAFSTGISICVTSGYATNDTTNATASAMSVNVAYQ